MPMIDGFTMERQEGAEMCWAAAVRSVLEHYCPGQCPDQASLRLRYGVQGQEAASPEPALRGLRALHSVESFVGDDVAMKHASRMFAKIHAHITRREPVVVYIQQAGGGGFRHALVAYGTSGTSTIHLRDPGNPNLALEADIHHLMSSWQLYQNVSGMEYMPLHVFARRFFFTSKPSLVFRLAS